MPSINRYEVTQERSIIVVASSPIEAAKLGQAAFDDTPINQFDGYLSGPVETISLDVRKEL